MTTAVKPHIPEGWELRRLKTVLEETDLRNEHDGTPLLSLTREHGLILQSESSSGSLVAQDLRNYRVCNPGDLVMNRMQAWSGIFATASTKGLVSPDYTVFRPKGRHDVGYLEHLVKTPLMVEQFAQRSKGIGSGFNRLYTPDFGDCRAPMPPPEEQAAIVRYLSHADELINRYINAKERLIALLEEQRQAVIHQAVTRGVTPNVSLKPSGVERLGDVPAHWEVRRLRTLTEMRVSNVDKHSKDGEIPVRLCNYVDVYKNDSITAELHFMAATATASEIERFRLVPGDVVITKDSETWNDIGVPALVESSANDLICGYHLALLRPLNGALNGSYLLRALQTAPIAYQFHAAANGVTRYGLTHDAIKSVLLPLPPSVEQAAIAEYLDKATADINAAIARALRQVELMQEYRTRLIADAVTGQVDVRNATADLPMSTVCE